MRLLDNIFINLEMLPITDKEKALLQNAEFQTNDLGRGRQDCRIIDDGFLELIDQEWGSIAKERRKKVLGYERIEDVHKDIFFHASALADEDLDWGDLDVGQRVEIGTVFINPKGIQAIDVRRIRPNKGGKQSSD